MPPAPESPAFWCSFLAGPTPVEHALAAMFTPGVLPSTLVGIVLCDYIDHAIQTIENGTEAAFDDLHATTAAFRDAFWRGEPAPSLLSQPPSVQAILLWFGDFTRSRMNSTGPAHVYRAVALGAATRAAEVIGRDVTTGQLRPARYTRALRAERAWQHQHLLRVLQAARDGTAHPAWVLASTPDAGPNRG